MFNYTSDKIIFVSISFFPLIPTIPLFYSSEIKIRPLFLVGHKKKIEDAYRCLGATF